MTNTEKSLEGLSVSNEWKLEQPFLLVDEDGNPAFMKEFRDLVIRLEKSVEKLKPNRKAS